MCYPFLFACCEKTPIGRFDELTDESTICSVWADNGEWSAKFDGVGRQGCDSKL